jgi:hypothetical protein
MQIGTLALETALALEHLRLAPLRLGAHVLDTTLRLTRTRGGLLECELLRGAQLGAQFRQALVGSALARRGDARACFSLLELLDVSSLPCSGTICGDPSHEGLTCSIRPGCCFRPSRRSRSPLCTGAPEPTRLPIRTSMPLVRSVGRLGLPS